MLYERMLDIFINRCPFVFICRQSRSNPITNDIEFLNVEPNGQMFENEKRIIFVGSGSLALLKVKVARMTFLTFLLSQKTI